MEKERVNQKRRTRQDLLQAAARLMKSGRTPTLAEVAEEALISRATAYRYFSSQEALLVEAPLDGVVPTPEKLFAEDPSTDPEERLLKADAALHEMIWGNQTQCRLLLAHLLEQAAKTAGDPDPVLRQNRRTDLMKLRWVRFAISSMMPSTEDPVRLCTRRIQSEKPQQTEEALAPLKRPRHGVKVQACTIDFSFRTNPAKLPGEPPVA